MYKPMPRGAGQVAPERENAPTIDRGAKESEHRDCASDGGACHACTERPGFVLERRHGTNSVTFVVRGSDHHQVGVPGCEAARSLAIAAISAEFAALLQGGAQ